MTHDLDQLLSAPLPEIADNGFSAKVMMHIYRRQQQMALAQTLLFGLLAVLIVPFVPWEIILAIMVPLLANTATLVALGTAGAALVLTIFVERELLQN